MLETLIANLSALSQVEAIALGGSRAGDCYDVNSDYDVYVYWTEEIPQETRREILKDHCSILEIGNHFWEPEDNCVLNEGTDIDIIYRNLSDFIREVASVVEDHYPHNGYTTCMWHNLLNCKILYDREGRLAEAQERFRVPYPEALRENILKRNLALLDGALPCYRTQIFKALDRGDIISVSHRTTAFLESYFDVIFALNRKPHPGEKRLLSLCMAQCDILPKGFEENIQGLLGGLYGPAVETKARVDQILGELKKIL